RRHHPGLPIPDRASDPRRKRLNPFSKRDAAAVRDHGRGAHRYAIADTYGGPVMALAPSSPQPGDLPGPTLSIDLSLLVLRALQPSKSRDHEVTKHAQEQSASLG